MAVPPDIPVTTISVLDDLSCAVLGGASGGNRARTPENIGFCYSAAALNDEDIGTDSVRS